MAIKRNEAGIEQAKQLIKQGQINKTEDNWEKAKPTPESEDSYLTDHSIEEYGAWFLAVNTDHPADTKSHYEFPYGDFEKIYRSGALAAEKRAAQYKHDDVEAAAHELVRLIDKR